MTDTEAEALIERIERGRMGYSELAKAAIDAIRALVAERYGLRASRIAYASEFAPDAEGLPDVGSIHTNIRAMKAEREGLKKDAECMGRIVCARKAMLKRRAEVLEADRKTQNITFHDSELWTYESQIWSAIDAALQASKEPPR